MMFKAVLALATMMVAAGGFAIFNGTGMILNERGWTQVIGGTVVLSTGLLILSLAGLLTYARTLFAPVDRTDGVANGLQPVPDQPAMAVEPVLIPPIDIGHGHPAEGHHAQTAVHDAGIPHDHPPVAVPHQDYAAAAEPIAAFAETFERDYPAAVSAYKPSRHQTLPQQRSAHGLLADLVPPPVPMPVAKPDEWSQVSSQQQPEKASLQSLQQPSLLDNLNQAAPYQASYEPVRPTMPPAHTIERELVASYTAGGVGYFMYSDQTIEAEMAIGRYRFASMDELRHFVETNEGGVKIGESSQI
jgi:hypothetical protein